MEGLKMITYNEVCEKYTLPLLPMRGVIAFPGVSLSFEVARSFSKTALETAQKLGSFIFLVAQKDQNEEEKIISNIENVGVIAKIKQVIASSDGNLKAVVEGVARAELVEISRASGYYIADISKKSIEVEGYSEAKKEALLRSIKAKASSIVSMFPTPSKEFISKITLSEDIAFLCDFIASNLLVKLEDKQAVLDEFDPYKRAEVLVKILSAEAKIIKLEAAIQKKTKEKIDESQRDYYLREQLKVIQSELGNDTQSDSEEIYDEIISKKFPKEVEDKLLKELYKFNKAPFGTPESTVLRAYLETCLEIPFNKYTKDATDVSVARKVLDDDHYGLQKVKERILEFIAVKELNPEIKNQIICLVGPPGVGKTSLCSSIARALKRKYVRVSLGGIRDEADIRGHRKTYVGAMPGRIINALIECQSANPLMVLDEIDKMASDSRGDPASAMLEVLDGEQNKAFRDHFVEMSVDLSHCMFIATANSLDGIPKPLIDRMEIIELSSYTKVEKLNIAKNHLIPKQIKRHGLTKRSFKLSDSAILEIIDSYTAEAGVRNLEREIASLCRKAAKQIIEDGAKTVSITTKNLGKLLGAKKFEAEKIDEYNQVGVVNGMAYTSIGGDLLKIEASVMKGTGKIQLTGQLGEVMKESAEIAISYIRENAEKLGIDPDFYSKMDIHIHAPEGAIPKDGPSAGVTMTTALVSILSARPVRRDIAMTGEITLRGKVLPIGGLREKTLAAYSAGVKTILIPEKNIKNLEEIEPIVKENVKFVPCKTLDDIFKVAFAGDEIITTFIGHYATNR
ncbi:MAG: endopeptidase La [Ruminococcaceae bacterium]|nr:endopeptidase La [Oscillospiraceae bacterium]